MPDLEREQQQSDGERWLQLIGYGHLKGQPTGYMKDGAPVLAEQFDQLCGEHARPIFAALEQIDQTDPRFQQFREVARKAFDSYFGSPESSS
jgi:hypothetical protein